MNDKIQIDRGVLQAAFALRTLIDVSPFGDAERARMRHRIDAFFLDLKGRVS